MARKMGVAFTLLWTLLLILVANNNVGGQSNCPMALTTLSPCLTLSTSNTSTPSASCCSVLANLVQTAPSCLCEALNVGGAQAVGFVLGRTLPSSLPGACNLHLPPMDQCQGLGMDPDNTQTQGSQSENGAYSNATSLNMPLLVAILTTFLASFALLLN